MADRGPVVVMAPSTRSRRIELTAIDGALGTLEQEPTNRADIDENAGPSDSDEGEFAFFKFCDKVAGRNSQHGGRARGG